MADQKIPDPKKFTITIQSILGGISAFSDFARKDQFRSSYSIDPDQNLTAESIASGLLRPASYEKFSDTTITHAPTWMVTNPKDANVYVYSYVGSVYTFDASFSMTELTDLNDASSSSGNGMAYYDNYIYAATSDTVARYGPLNGAAVWTDSYWKITLSKSALTDTTYPADSGGLQLSNHPMLRHSDGKLYFGDVVGNQGVLHCISTTKTSVEGDTDNGSTFNVIDFPYGFWPTALETYGENIAVALYEGSNNTAVRQRRAKLSFWDTTNPNTYDKIIDIEFPDPIITALKNSNGILYVFSGQIGTRGTRISRFVGGYSFEQVAFIEEAFPPRQGAVDGFLNKIIFGSRITNYSSRGGCVFSVGSKSSAISNEIFNIMGCSSANTGSYITALAYVESVGYTNLRPVTGWNNGGSSGGTNNGLDRQNNPSIAYFTSQKYRIGQPFKITKVRIPLTESPVSSSITPTIRVDDAVSGGTALTAINSTNYPSKRNIVYRTGITGDHSFQIELQWNGSSNTVSLPITIEGEYLDD